MAESLHEDHPTPAMKNYNYSLIPQLSIIDQIVLLLQHRGLNEQKCEACLCGIE